MNRIWKATVPPKYLHDNYGVYRGIWMPQMDRCWMSDDGIQVTSRLLMTEWGKVEHAAITLMDGFSVNGEGDLPWSTKMEIKNELFGEDRLAIEVYPKARNLVDVMDVYHMWVFPKDFALPFGIHPTRDIQAKWINRGCPKDVTYLVKNTESIAAMHKERQARTIAADGNVPAI